MPSDVANEFAPLATFDRPATDANAASRIEIRAVEPGNGLSSIARWSVRRVEKTGTSELEVERGVFGIDRGDDGFVARLEFRGLARGRDVDAAIVGVVADEVASRGITSLRIRGDSGIRMAMARLGIAVDKPVEYATELVDQAVDIVRYRLDMDGWTPRVREPMVSRAVQSFALAVESRFGKALLAAPSGLRGRAPQPTVGESVTAAMSGTSTDAQLNVARRAVAAVGPGAIVDITIPAPDGSGPLPVGEWLVTGLFWHGRIDQRNPQGRPNN